MLHVVAHARPRTLVFRTWAEGLLAWRTIIGRVPLRALALMPDHVHALVPDEAARARLVRALVAYAQARNARRGERGSVWSEGIEATPVRGEEHVRRSMRYVHLNPVRKGLVDDPLAWPLSTHRDLCGLAIESPVAAARDPARFHAWVSADPSVAPEGTALPGAAPAAPPHPRSWDALRAAVSALARVTVAEITRRGRARSLLLRAARQHGGEPVRTLAGRAAVHRATVYRAGQAVIPALPLVDRVAGDPRFSLLDEGDLRESASWREYRRHR